jgi:hypothetical protein
VKDTNPRRKLETAQEEEVTEDEADFGLIVASWTSVRILITVVYLNKLQL